MLLLLDSDAYPNTTSTNILHNTLFDILFNTLFNTLHNFNMAPSITSSKKMLRKLAKHIRSACERLRTIRSAIGKRSCECREAKTPRGTTCDRTLYYPMLT